MSSLAIRRAAPANPVTASVATAQVFGLLSNPLVPCTVAVPGKLVLEAKRFSVRAEGDLQTVGAYTAKATLLAAITIPAVPFTATNWTVLGAGTARAVGTTYSSWFIDAEAQFDSTAGALQGTFAQLISNLYDVRAAFAATIAAGINGTNAAVVQAGPVTVQPADPCLYFAVALTFGTAGLNIGNLANFELGF